MNSPIFSWKIELNITVTPLREPPPQRFRTSPLFEMLCSIPTDKTEKRKNVLHVLTLYFRLAPPSSVSNPMAVEVRGWSIHSVSGRLIAPKSPESARSKKAGYRLIALH